MAVETSRASFRRFRPDDAGQVKALVDRTVDTCYDPAYPAEARAFFKQHHSCDSVLEDAGRGLTIVAVAGGEVVGTGTLVDGGIRRVFVAPECQGQGVGGGLMDRLEEEAMGLESIELDASLVSLGFYLHRGYQVVRAASIAVAGGKTLDYFVMRKPARSPQAGSDEQIEDRTPASDGE